MIQPSAAHLLSGFLLVFSSICTATSASEWLKNLSLPDGVDMGNGLSLRLQKLNRSKATPLERHALRLDYSGYGGVSFVKAQERDAVEMAFYTEDHEEGRGKKGDSATIMMLLGYKLASISAAFFAIVTALVMKSMMVAKIALVLSTVLLVHKLFQHKPHSEMAHVEFEPPEYEFSHPEFHSGGYGGDFHPSASSNAYYAYANGFVGDGSAGYAAVDPSVGNSSDVGREVVGVAALKRREYKKRKNKVPLFTIHRYSTVQAS